MALWILSGVFALVGLPMVWLARRTFARDAAARAWPRAFGVITSSSVEQTTRKTRDRHGFYRDHTMCRPVVRFTYTAQGRQLEGTTLSRQSETWTSRAAAEQAIAPYPPGTEVEVLHDPNDPTIAFLEVHRSIGAVILLAFGGLWLGLAALLLVLALWV
ncbi:MAG: DUF3592 domain-containing protein [Planctomycetes bacterium]|nr:DUF3592 domain-containing protein [Planctomycetota bacterium]